MGKQIVKMANYDAFQCSADRCTFTCCKQWKIAVDGATEAAWEKCGLADPVITKDGGRVVALDEQGNCPYLNKKKLCDVVIAHGDQMIPRTCQLFPRQIHEFADRTEQALVACCPDVVDWLAKAEAVVTPEDLAWPIADEPSRLATGALWTQEEEMRVLRDWMIYQVQDPRYSIARNLKMIFYILLELYRTGEKDLVGGLVKCVEALPELAAAMNQVPVDWEETLWERNELFLDVTENYWKQDIYREQLAPLREAAEALEDAAHGAATEILSGGMPGKKSERGTTWREAEISAQYDRLFRNYLACELFANGLLPETGLRELIVMTQWIGMEYALICHGARLAGPDISYEELRELIVVTARMTGYDFEDIEEYLENSFESAMWEWGYFALLLP